MAEHVDSASDDRTANNAVRHAYRVLSDDEKAMMVAIKDAGANLLLAISAAAKADQANVIGLSRELSIARTKTEEAVMWAVKHITA